MILIVTQRVDGHVDYVVDKLSSARKNKIVRFNTEEFPTSVSIMLSKNPSISVMGKNYQLSDFSCVWFRRPADPYVSQDVVDEVARKYALDECRNLLNSLWEGMDWVLWVNKPAKIKAAKHKWSQSAVAQRLGFICPETLVTNNPDEARSFCSRVGYAIVKPVFTSHFQTRDGWNMIYANPITSQNPRIQDVELAPAIFQQYISKKLELRVTVVGESVFACAIESQSNEKTKDDWRHYDLDNTPHYQFDLPKYTEDLCRQIVKYYDLNYGAIDLILTPKGEYVFLELNPNGQWLWIEGMTNLSISDALIDLLFSHE
ncbi:MAG: MvdC/MvdD family ATP grasp protein [Candidatus Uhrbacteria bacterium]